MKKCLTLLFCVVTLSVGSCSDTYDDSALWKDIDGIYKSLNELQSQVSSMQEQLDALSAIVNSGAITGIEQLDEGGYTIHYKDAESLEHSFVVATQDEVTLEPIIGMKEESGTMYWTTTVEGTTSWLLDTDGARIPVAGRSPELAIDDQGYWTLFGNRITDQKGNEVKASGKSASVITRIEKTDHATVIFTLGDGTSLEVQLQDGFNVAFDVEAETFVEDAGQPLVVHYTLIGQTESSVLRIESAEGLEAQLDEAQQTITVTFPDGFERGSLIVMFYDGEENMILKPLVFTTYDGEATGICTAEDLKAFAVAVNTGKSLSRYLIDGEVALMNDIDMTGVDWSDCMIGGTVTPSTTTANKAVTYTLSEEAFSLVFNGHDHTLKNIDWTFDLSDGNVAHGLFSGLAAAGEIRNLTLEGRIRLTGTAPQGTAIGAFAGYAEGKLSNCTSRVNIVFEGEDASNISVCLGGVVGYGLGAALSECDNSGTLTCQRIANTANGANSGFHQGGIIGYAKETTLSECDNEGSLSAPSGRGGGILGVGVSGTAINCHNRGFIQDDVEGIFAPNPGYKRMGGIAGGLSSGMTLDGCVNEGNVFSQLGCRTGGFVGHNEGTVIRCENRGIILSDHTVDGTNYHGSGWAAGYNKSADLITDCIIGGRVGDYTACKDNPESAPEATFSTAIAHGKFDAELNGLNDQYEEFYDWTVEEETSLAEGVTFSHYALKNIAQNIYVVTVDLTNPNLVLETVMADEICPNPNANGNANNGKNLRETLSETCTRRRAEGRNIVAGINTGFFDSNDGFPRGMHIEYGEPVFVNNPAVRASLTNHRPGFTLFEDRSISFGYRDFRGEISIDGTSIPFYSINDTIVRLNSASEYEANLYTSRFVKEPHPGIQNPVGTKALFVVARGSQNLTVNQGAIDAQVTAIVDGRDGSAVEVPFVTGRNEWVLQATGATAETLAAKVKVGSTLRLTAEVPIDGEVRPITMHNASMYRFLDDGKWGALSGSDDPMPATCCGADQAGTTVKLVCVDGRTATDTGLTYWQLYMVMKKLGLYNAIRFDGGGSTTMWTWKQGAGSLANHPSDSNGERSCMNYMHVRVK